QLRLSDAVAALTIAGEAASEPYDCKVGIGNVIRARMREPLRFLSDGTVLRTCLAPNQFSCWNRVSPPRVWMDLLDMADPVADECLKAWTQSAILDVVDGANFYYADTTDEIPAWTEHAEFKIQISHTLFYKL